MVEDINFLLDRPALLLMTLLTGALVSRLINHAVDFYERKQKRKYWRGRFSRKNRKLSPIEKPQVPVFDAAEQLRCAMEHDFSQRSLLNRGEKRVFEIIERSLSEENSSWRAMCQVSLGEILSSPNENAFRAVNSKRVDMLIVDKGFKPLYAIELQGSGHHLGNTAAARDAVKKEALRKAGVGYIEIISGDTPAELRRTIGKLVRAHNA